MWFWSKELTGPYMGNPAGVVVVFWGFKRLLFPLPTLSSRTSEGRVHSGGVGFRLCDLRLVDPQL